MSHFTVMVLSDGTKTVEELLAPYDENISVEPYIGRTKSEIITHAKEMKKRIEQKIKENKDCSISDFDKKFLKCKTDEDFYQAEHYEDEIYDEEGNELTTYNPISKWDWWQIGGRWEGMIKAKEGVQMHQKGVFGGPDPDDEHFDSALLGDIDFSIDEKELERHSRWWDVVIEGAPLEKGEKEEDFHTFFKKEYYLDRYKNKENFLKIACSFTTFAVITPDGKWHEKGEMGWFGLSSETGDESLDWDLNYKKKFIDSMPSDTLATIVDCHI